MLLLLVRFFFFVIFNFSMLEQQCPAQVLWRKTKTDEVEVWTRVLLSTEHSCCVTMKMMSKEQLTLSLSLLPEHWFYPPWLSRTQTAYELFSHLPFLPSLNANRGSHGHGTLAGNQRTYSTVRQNLPPREASGLSLCLSVWSIDHPTTIALPEIAVRDYLFGEPHLFFKWPYLSLKKWDTWGQWGRECFFFFLFFWFLNFLCASLSDLLSSRRHFCHWRHWASVV